MTTRYSSKVLRQIRLKEAQKRWKEFENEELDKKMIAELFRIAINAEAVVDRVTKKPLKAEDDIWFTFADTKYQYQLRRRPLK